MVTLPGRARRWTAVLALILAASACSARSPATHSATPSPGGAHPDLVAAATARLRAQAAGFAAGDAAKASSLSTGDAAADDQAIARSLRGQESSGDTTDYGFDVLEVRPYPAGDGDFIAYERTRSHADGTVSWEVERYHRDSASAPWRAASYVYLANNIDLPALQLDAVGKARLLTPGDLAAAGGPPAGVVSSFAVAMNAGATFGRLPADTFAPGPFTTGTIAEALQFLDEAHAHGSGSVHWSAPSNEAAIPLGSGTLVFGSLQSTRIIQEAAGANNIQFFRIQDDKRLTYGGLLAPGDYSAVTQTMTVRLAAVVPATGKPDIVGIHTFTTSVQATPVGSA